MKFDPNHLPVNWFDFAVVIILIFGYSRGRKHGMSVEMMYLLQWIAMIFGAAYAYKPCGDYLAGSTVISHLTCYIIAYLVTLIVIRIVFLLIRRAIGGKLVGSNVFGSGEYYLGMLGGVLRYACILIAVLALLNSRHYTVKEILTREKYINDVYGSDFFPSLHTIQKMVFQDSLLGPPVKKYLSFLLIKPTDPENRQIKTKEPDLPE